MHRKLPDSKLKPSAWPAPRVSRSEAGVASAPLTSSGRGAAGELCLLREPQQTTKGKLAEEEQPAPSHPNVDSSPAKLREATCHSRKVLFEQQ